MSVRGKFYVDTVKEFQGGAKEIILKAVTSGYESTPEDQRFHKYTPSAEIKMVVDNPIAGDQFRPGKRFYVDFTEAPEFQ